MTRTPAVPRTSVIQAVAKRCSWPRTPHTAMRARRIVARVFVRCASLTVFQVEHADGDTGVEARRVGDRGRAEVGERSGTHAFEEVHMVQGMWRDGNHPGG